MNKTLRRLFCWLSMSVLVGCQPSQTESNTPTSQALLDQAAQQIELSIEIVSNVNVADCPNQARQCYLAVMELSLPASMPADWSIYFSQISPIRWVGSEYFDIEHLNGDLHRLSVRPGVQVAAGNYQIPFKGHNWLVSESGLFPNHQLVVPGLQARVIQSTQERAYDGEQLIRQSHIKPFDKPTQTQRGTADKMPLANANWRYQQYRRFADLAMPEPQSRVIPSVKQIVSTDARVTLDSGLFLVDSNHLNPVVAQYWQQLGIPISSSAEQALALKFEQQDMPAEHYQLEISTDVIRVVSGDETGRFYALMTLAQLYDTATSSWPELKIEDGPRYGFRGVHVDVARNFHSVAFMQRLLEQMAKFKLNKLHLHLADDEGWRLEINGLLELTDVGAKRCFDLQEQRCLLPQLGAGNEPDSPVNGYFSEQQYRQLLQFAQQRHIEVIPALDMPGHSRAAIVSMAARYQRLMEQGDVIAANEFYLTEAADESQYHSVQYYSDNTLNPCIDSTYRFIDKVLTEVKRMHQQAGVPLTRYHIGADETAGAWQDSPACQALIAAEPGLSEAKQLSAYFIEKVAQSVAEQGLTPAAWSDGLSHADPTRLPPGIQSNDWNTLFWGATQSVHKSLDLGWQVVLSLPDVLYFDFPYQVDPLEPGYHWGSRATNSYQVFQFMPDNLPVHAQIWTDRMGRPFAIQDAFPKTRSDNVAGIQAQLWSETVRSDQRAEYMLFPRLLAFAERAWHRPDWAPEYVPGLTHSENTAHFDADAQQQMRQDWWQFSARVSQYAMPDLVAHGIQVRVPMPGAVVENGLLKMNSEFAGLALEYSLQGDQWVTYQQPVAVAEAVRIRARIKNTSVTSRIETVLP